MQEITLGDLIESSRHRRGEKSLSYAELAKLCGGKPTAARLQQYVTGDLKNFPDPDSIRGLAKGTRTTPREIVLASARSLGLHIETETEDLLLIQGSSTLPASALESLKSIGRELVNLSRKADHAPPQDHHDNLPDPHSKPPLRAVAPKGDTRPGQKASPEDLGVTEIFGEEARNYPLPDLDQMAAHPNFKSKREKWEEAHGERGEENQDPGEGF